MRPYVAFNAELRAAFQGCIARMEEHCAALVRHELEVATSAFARRISLASLSLEDDGCEDAQNVPPVPSTQVLHDRAGHNIPPPTQILQERYPSLIHINSVNSYTTGMYTCEYLRAHNATIDGKEPLPSRGLSYWKALAQS